MQIHMNTIPGEETAVKRLPKDTIVHAGDHPFPAFALGTEEASLFDDRQPGRHDADQRADYRVWRCNGVPVGVRIHKENKDG